MTPVSQMMFTSMSSDIRLRANNTTIQNTYAHKAIGGENKSQLIDDKMKKWSGHTPIPPPAPVVPFRWFLLDNLVFNQDIRTKHNEKRIRKEGSSRKYEEP